MKFILINGMPRSGKDTAYDAILNGVDASKHWVYRERFSYPLKWAFTATLNITNLDDSGLSIEWEAKRDKIVPQLGATYRQFQIDYSEKFLKPLYGNDVFAKLLLGRISDFNTPAGVENIWVIPDCGFQVEVDTLLRNQHQGSVMILRIHRAGCTWDSREWVRSIRATERDIFNNSTIEAFGAEVLSAVKPFLEQTR